MVRTYFFVRTMIAASCLLLNSLAVAECNASPLSGQNAQKVAKHRGEATFRRLRPGVWLHATYMPIGSFGPVVSYGLVIERKDHALLIDSGWNDTQTKDILDWARHDLEKPVTIGIFTHSHNDKMGGVAAVEASGARTLSRTRSPMSLHPGEASPPPGRVLIFSNRAMSLTWKVWRSSFQEQGTPSIILLSMMQKPAFFTAGAYCVR